MAIGPNPRNLEELRIGGGYGDSRDGGADFEKNGDIATDGDITSKGILSAGSTPQALTNAAGQIDGAKVQSGTINSSQLASDLSVTGEFTAEDLTVGGKLVVAPDTELGIVSGVITVTQMYHSLTGESDSTDDLDTINGGVKGQLLILRPASGAYSITIKDTSGNLKIAGDFLMDDSTDMILLFKGGNAWQELSRSNNG